MRYSFKKDEGEGMWLMDFIYLYEIEQWNLLQLLKVRQGGSQGRDGGCDLTNV
jgi:hypothetical protein